CPQHEFHKRMGFKRVGEDPFLLFYPSKESARVPAEKGYKPQEEDAGRAVIFYDPLCPFCIYFSACTRDLVREVASDIRIRMINQFENHEEVEKRGKVPFCIVNKRATVILSGQRGLQDRGQAGARDGGDDGNLAIVLL
ncbi:MAG: hypothetical protein ACE5QW_09780, partial [Thermoplasmata archaeon]